MPFEIVHNDIVHMQVDALVNTANPLPIVGSGVDRAIHDKAGAELLKAREKIGSIAFGDAVMTPGYGLDAPYVIHTVGPIWKGGHLGEEQLLASCYRKSLQLARDKGCESIAFPLLSTGNYKFPKPSPCKLPSVKSAVFFWKTKCRCIWWCLTGKPLP